MSCFETILLICLCLVSLSIADPIPRARGLDSAPAKTTPNCNGKLRNLSDKSCELHCRPQDFNIWRPSPFELTFPIRYATPPFRESCNAFLTQANEHSSVPSLIPSFKIKHSSLELASPLVGGSRPWVVVTDFAHKMLSAIQMGHFGKSEDTYQNGVADHAVGATLRTASNQHSLSPRDLANSKTARAAKRRDLKKRNGYHLTSYRIHADIVPVSAAAPFMKAFFDAIAAMASNEWASMPEKPLMTITYGSFQLTVSCLGAGIPWPILVSLAREFSSLADRMWATTFDAYFEEPGTAITVAISLRLLQQARGGGLARSTTTSRSLRPRNLQGPSPEAGAPSTTPLVGKTARTALESSSSAPPGLRLTSFVRTTAVVPGAIAAVMFEDFYTIIATKIETGQLAHRPPAKYLACSLWDFELSFWCDAVDVPLSFVQAFAIDMAEWSSRQFTGFYEATVRGEGPLTGLVFFVRMRLKDKG